MGVLKETFELANGVCIPALGFGTWQIPEGDLAYESVLFALQSGYRHVDTAFNYGNEPSVGRAVRESGMRRGDLFVTSKLPGQFKSAALTRKFSGITLSNLGLDFLDLYLIHSPGPANRGLEYIQKNKEVWAAMEELYESGLCRAIGVSNFEIADLAPLLESCRIKPMVNQIKFHIGHTQPELTAFCRDNGIMVEGYSPLATGTILNNRILCAMAEDYGKTPSQLCLRYVLQKEVLPLAKSTHPKYISENTEFDFEIGETDMEALDCFGDWE